MATPRATKPALIRLRPRPNAARTRPRVPTSLADSCGYPLRSWKGRTLSSGVTVWSGVRKMPARTSAVRPQVAYRKWRRGVLTSFRNARESASQTTTKVTSSTHLNSTSDFETASMTPIGTTAT
jgi:hypothetical protein